MNIVLAIHPKWATLIYSGKKTIEFRKSFPKIYYPLMKIFIYETAPVCRVTGYFTQAGTKRFQDVDWTKADAYHKKILDAGCVPAEDLNAYQGPQKRLCGWGVEKTVKLDRRLTLLDLGINTPPQSWCYTDYEITAFGQGRTAK